MESVIAALPASNNRLQQYQDAQETDPICSSLRQYCTEGWPEKHKLSVVMCPTELHSHLLTISYCMFLVL